MRLPSRGHTGALAIVVAFVIAAAVVAAVWRSVAASHSVARHLPEAESAIGATGATRRAAQPSNGATVTVGPDTTGERMRPGFLGFSFE